MGGVVGSWVGGLGGGLRGFDVGVWVMENARWDTMEEIEQACIVRPKLWRAANKISKEMLKNSILC